MTDHSGASRRPGSLATIEIAKDYLNFSAGHFTIFSASERENLHGHNWRVGCEIETPIGDDGLCFDYGLAKKALMALCEQLDEKVLLPTQSPHLRIEEGTPYLLAHYGSEAIPFLPRDVLLLPLANITVEALAGWFVEALLADPSLPQAAITGLRVRVSSGTEQWASRYWSAS